MRYCLVSLFVCFIAFPSAARDSRTDLIIYSLNLTSAGLSYTTRVENTAGRQTAFVQHNRQHIHRDLARQSGEMLTALSHLYELPKSQILNRSHIVWGASSTSLSYADYATQLHALLTAP